MDLKGEESELLSERIEGFADAVSRGAGFRVDGDVSPEPVFPAKAVARLFELLTNVG
jgi:hypothetical protein